MAILVPVAKSVDSQCQTFQTAIAVLGRQWNGLILNVLLAGPLRFSELSERAQGPGDKVLSARLKELEGRGLLLRQGDARPPGRGGYEVARTGRALCGLGPGIGPRGRGLVEGGQAPRR